MWRGSFDGEPAGGAALGAACAEAGGAAAVKSRLRGETARTNGGEEALIPELKLAAVKSGLRDTRAGVVLRRRGDCC
jgi:hypothetical protein